jgi:lipid-binding SYLF domain-containing protein
MRRPLAAFATCLLIIATVVPAALAGQVEDERAVDAARVLGEIMRIPEDRIPDKLLTDAEAIAVIPNVMKASFVIGGRRGRGLISVRSKDGTWSNPSFITLTGGSFGFQAGVQSTDIILVFRTRSGVDSIVSGKFTLGADASVAAGPVGRSAQASTDEHLKAEILSYSRARGLFAGVALDGTRLGIDNKSNQRVYGSGNTARAIFEGRAGGGSDATVAFRDKLEESTVPQRAR